MEVVILHEKSRGCGFRKPSKDGVGIYLRGGSSFEDCERLPWLLDTCPCCGQGYKFSRSFTWINPMNMFDPYVEPHCSLLMPKDINPKHSHERCWMCNPELLGSKAGLIWVGEKFYPRPEDFMSEAHAMGISRKIGALPNGFEVGEHAIFLAHLRTFAARQDDGSVVYSAGVFGAFKPTSVDLVIDNENRVPDRALEIAKRIGKDKVRIVKVIPDRDENESEEGEWGNLEEA